LRIISGSLRGKKLHSICGLITRPTADRLRESVFNILSSRHIPRSYAKAHGENDFREQEGMLREAVVLDLFAGTGAFGIEALSRGAAFAVFVEKHRDALSVIARNIRSCAFESRAKFIRWDIKHNLKCIKSNSFSPFNLVFMDPPYDKNLIKPALCNLHSSHSLEKGACIVVEHSLLEPIPEDFPDYALSDQRRYGKTLVSFLDYML